MFAISRRILTWFISTKKIARPRSTSTPSILAPGSAVAGFPEKVTKHCARRSEEEIRFLRWAVCYSATAAVKWVGISFAARPRIRNSRAGDRCDAASGSRTSGRLNKGGHHGYPDLGLASRQVSTGTVQVEKDRRAKMRNPAAENNATVGC